ncbi:MAG TPA: DsrE family protein [Gammaproteobacteria bacterium]|nr:DsrE family protein [Gammaproteobacteria bacterium]
MNSNYYLDNEEKSVVIIMTSGPSTPHRCATPFYLGAILASMDADVNIFFTMEGVRLCEKGVAENLAAMEGGKKIIEFMREAKNAGVKLHLCLPALPGYEIDAEADVIEEIDELSGGGVLADLILSSDKILQF